jgi:hypothetical protein
MPTYTVKAEAVSSTTKSQAIVVKAIMALPITTKSKRSSPSRANKRSRKQSKNHQNLLSCPAAMASIALFFMISALLLLSQLNCFNKHFGLPKSVTDARVTHSANGSHVHVELMVTTEVTLDRASLAKLQAHAKSSGGGPLEITMDLPSILNGMKSGGQPIQLSDEQIQKAIFSQIPQLEPAQQRRGMPMPTNTAGY